MPKRNKLKSAKAVTQKTEAKVYDFRSSDLVMNAQVAAVEIDDPLEPGAKAYAFKSIRDDPLNRMFIHGHIDKAQLEAGEKWREAFEVAEIGGAKAIDWTKERVDGGRLSEPFTERQRRAFRTLARAADALGRDGDALVRDVLGRRMFLNQAAAARGLGSERGIAAIGRKFKEYLEILVLVFDLATAAKCG